MTTNKTEYMRAWRQAHPEIWIVSQTRYRQSAKGKEGLARRMRKYTYGITDVQFNTLMLTQCGKCAICSEVMEKPNVDHDHKTGVVRALLCNPCNQGMGSLKDSAELLRVAADYLDLYA